MSLSHAGRFYLGYLIALLLIAIAIALYGCKLPPKYITEAPGADYWQTCEETHDVGGGDCEDLAICDYFADPQSAWIVIGTAPGVASHAWVSRNGVVTDPLALTGGFTEEIRFNTEQYIRNGIVGDACLIVKWRGVMDRMGLNGCK